MRSQNRVIVPDLPSHGRSSGLHDMSTSRISKFSVGSKISQQSSRRKLIALLLGDSTYQVLVDVARRDAVAAETEAVGLTGPRKRKVFIAGQSLGGLVALMTCIKYDSTSCREEICPCVAELPLLDIAGAVRPFLLWLTFEVLIYSVRYCYVP